MKSRGQTIFAPTAQRSAQRQAFSGCELESMVAAMRTSASILFSLVAAIVMPHSLQASLETYPAPSKTFPASPHYQVRVEQNGTQHDAFVHLSKAQWRTNVSEDVSYTGFAFEGQVKVTITNRVGDFDSARVLPSSRGIELNREGNSVSFVIDQPGQFAVEFDESIAHPLFVFADAPETDTPSPDDPKVHYFGPGEHFLGIPGLVLRPGESVYLAPGAFVKGRIYGQDTPEARVYGRGILSGQHLPAQPTGEYSVPHMVHFDWTAPDVTIEGITIIGSPHYNIVAEGARSTVRNVKIMGWWYGTDGIGTGPDGLVEECFIKANDDAIKVYGSGMRVRRCVIWQMENGAAFNLSWNLNQDQSDFHISDIDIIRVEHRAEANNRGIFASIHGGSAHLNDYLFENIRIENADWRLFLLTIHKTYWAKAKDAGKLSNIVFRNITADRPFQHPSELRSDEAKGTIENVVFENLIIDGKHIKSAEQANLLFHPERVKEVSFK